MRFDAIQSNFTAGELSPKLWGRVELEKYFSGLATLENMIVQPHGGVDRRGGFHFVAEAKYSDKETILINFNYKGEYSYILEFGRLYMRVYLNGIQIQSGDTPYELATSFTEDEVADLRFSQDTDTLYIAHKNYTPKIITRSAHSSWTIENITFTANPWGIADNDWQSVCWSPELGLFVAIANTGTDNRITTSLNGINWIIRTSAADNNWTSICWSPELTLFCAVANTGTNDRIMTSPNGINWTIRTSAEDNDWTSICWNSDLEQFVATAKTGTGDRIMTSPDGVTWSCPKVDFPINNDWQSICWSPELELFCAVSNTGTANRVATSPNGVTWTTRVSAADNNWASVCWSPGRSLFVAVGYTAASVSVMTSANGINWSDRTIPSHQYWQSVCWSPKLSLFCAVSYLGTSGVMTSSTGITWTNRTAISSGWASICWSPELELFVAVGTTFATDRIMTSSNGITWTGRTSPVANDWQSVCWSPELNLFVAVAATGTNNRVMTSSNGIVWTVRTSAANNAWTSVCWNSELDLFVAVADTGTNNRVMTSPDGITWTTRTSAVNIDWQSICWNPDLKLYVAIADTGTGNRIMTSVDGINWITPTPIVDNNWTSICWSSNLDLFCAVANSGTGNRIMTSPNRINWTIRTSAADENWTSVCWSPTLTLFVAVANSGTNNRVMTSPDGVTWTIRTSAADNDWTSVCWSPELALFVAVADSGTGNRVMTSPDGVTWTIRTSAGDNDWTSVCWSPELTLFVAMADTGVGNRTMTSPDGITWTIRTLAGEYPTLTWFYEQRLFWAATNSEPEKIWGSRSADYFNLDPGTGLDDEALIFNLKTAVKLLWASAGQEILLGAHNGEFKLAANALNEVLTPSNVRPTLHTSYGSAFLPPIRIDESVLFVQRGHRRFRRLASGTQTGSYSSTYTAEDVTILSEHITKTGIKDIAYFNEPNSIAWAVREDGVLIGLTYEPEHKIYGWHRHLVGGTNVKVKNIATTDVSGGVINDELWAVIERTVDGSTVQYIEYMIPGLSIENEIEDAFFIDSGITETGSGLTLVANLDHLEGEEVQILGDGAIQAPKTVSGGSITLDYAADKVQVGLPYTSILETLPIEGGNPIGTSQALIKRIKNVSLRLHRSANFLIGDIFGNMDEYYLGPSVMNEPIPLFTDDTEPIPFAGEYDKRSQIRIVQENPLPLEIQAIMYNARTK